MLSLLLVAALLWWSQALRSSANAGIGVGRPDRVRVAYVLPIDAIDDPAAQESLRVQIEVANSWFQAQSGKRLRFETQPVDFERVYLKETVLQLSQKKSAYRTVHDEVRRQLEPDKRELVLALVVGAGSRQNVCGQASDMAIVWIERCATSVFAGGVPSELSRTIAHEIVHALGAVPKCAPHFDGHFHVNDSPRDIVYSGAGASPRIVDRVLDVGHDDYFNTGRKGCPDIADQPIWVG